MTAGLLDFRNADATDLQACVEFLDLASSLGAVRQAKALGRRLLGLKNGSRVLDVGSGTGADALEMAREVGPSGHVVGVDTSAGLLDLARRRASSCATPVSFLKADIHVLPFEDNSFDAVNVDRVLHFLPDPRAALAEVARVVAPAGRVVLTEPDWGTLSISGGDDSLTPLIVSQACGQGASRIGASLEPLAATVGLSTLHSHALRLEVGQLQTALTLFSLEGLAQRAVSAGRISPKQAVSWLRSLQRADESKDLHITLEGTQFCGAKLDGN